MVRHEEKTCPFGGGDGRPCDPEACMLGARVGAKSADGTKPTSLWMCSLSNVFNIPGSLDGIPVMMNGKEDL